MAGPRRSGKGAETLRVLLDEGVPLSVGAVFENAGHQAIYHGDVLPSGASDLRVATAALTADAVLLAIDNDMKRIAGRYGSGDPRFARLHLIKLACAEPMAATRIRQAMSLIELEWRYACEKTSRRLYLEIGAHHMRTSR